MSSTLKRTSMALDEESLKILEELSGAWDVSKAEVMRRSLKQASEDHFQKHPGMTPLEALQSLLDRPPLTREQGTAWLEEIKAEREARPDPWENHATTFNK